METTIMGLYRVILGLRVPYIVLDDWWWIQKILHDPISL